MEDSTDQHSSPWWTYLTLTAITFTASLLGGWFNRSENRAKHEQLLGKIEEVQRDMRTLVTERSKR